MQFTTILAATGILAAHTFAAPAATSPPLEVTDLSIEKVDPGNVTITFNVYDPDPLTNSSTTCEGTWETGSKGYPTGSYVRFERSHFTDYLLTHSRNPAPILHLLGTWRASRLSSRSSLA